MGDKKSLILAFKVNYKSFYKLSVAYHKAVKRICRMNVWESNHVACALAGIDIFKHHYAKRMVNFIFSLVNNDGPCLHMLKYYFRF